MNGAIKKKHKRHFNINAAKAGSPCINERGETVRIISFDRHGKFPIVALVPIPGEWEENVICYNRSGIAPDGKQKLFMKY